MPGRVLLKYAAWIAALVIAGVLISGQPWRLGTASVEVAAYGASASRSADGVDQTLKEGWASPDQGGVIEHQGVRLEVPAGALDAPALLTLEALQGDAAPDLDSGLDNVTAPFDCLRLGPDGMVFKRHLSLTLPYDPQRLPPGTTHEEVFTYFFDVQSRRWIRLERLAVDPEAHTVTSRTDHFTDFVNAVLTVPDHPQGTNFEPNSISELALADPGAAITVIEEPKGGPNGSADLSFPLDLPPGRLGIQPELAVTYSSGRGNGWMGVGWDLQVPNIEVDTVFGVPRYDPQLETETYLVNGAYLAPTADLTSPKRRQPDRVFTRRVEGSFERIVRKGTAPDNYWWEVTDKNGTRFIYGQSASARLQDYQTPRNIFRWMLERIVGLHGNTVDVSYDTDSGTSGEPWVQIYPQRIDYTGSDGQGAYYRVDFVREGGNRPDRLSSGLPGFKTLTRFRLDHVDVSAGGDLVRRYRFLYRVGDFSKSLLQTIAVTGEDGSTELYRHDLEYYTMPTRPNGDIDGFTPQQTWGGMSSSDDATHSSSFSAGAHSFVGLAPNAACQGHAGAQVGASGGASSTERTFVDVNGDGLPDRIDEDGQLELNRDGSFQRTSISGADLLSRTNELHFDVGVGLHSPGEFAQAGTSFVWDHANDDHAVSDVNGDGWPDLVATQGSFSVRLNDRGQRFLSPQTWGGFSFEGIDLTVPEEEEQVMEKFPLSNSLRKLELPFEGKVSIGGTIQKIKAGGSDGVDVTIFKNSTSIWKRSFAAGDTSPCNPGPNNSCSGGLAQDVTAGDRLYFMADSIADTADDALAWVPSATYQGKDGSAREAYGARIFVFDAGQDFRLAGPPGGDWLASAKGRVRVLGTIEKQATADDVTVTISRASSQDKPVTPVTVFSLNLSAAQTGSFGDFPEIDVEVGNVLRFEVASDSQIDSDQVSWTPIVTYEGGILCWPITGPNQVCGPFECNEGICTVNGEPVPVVANTLTQPAQVLSSVHNPLPLNTPTAFWTAPEQSTYPVTVDWKAPAGGHTKPVLLYVQGLHTLFDKRQVPPGENELSYTVSVHLAPGDALYITALAADQADVGSLTAKVGEDSLPTNLRWNDPGGNVLSGGYHRWFYGEWNGSAPFKEPDDPESEDLIAGVPQWQGTKEVLAPQWRAAGFDLYHDAAGSKPSRQGGNVVVELGVAAGESGAGPQLVRKTYGYTGGFNVSAVASFTYSTADNVTQIDLADINGDHYPDQVAEGKVRFSNGHGAFGDLQDMPGFGSFRKTADGSYSLGIGLGIPFKKKDGKGKSKEVVSTMPSVGRTLSYSQPRTDLMDVNGDGLPDLVSMTPNTQSVTVQLNLGYRFGAAEQWALPAWKSAKVCNEFLQIPAGLIGPVDSPDALALNRSAADNAGLAIGPFGGGAATSISRNVVQLADINGDGLPDHLFKDQGEDFFRVKLNLGDRWADEQPWYAPPWQTSLGGIYDALGLFKCLDAVSLQGAINGNGSVGAPICIPLVVVGLQIEISVQGGGGAGGVQMLFEDLNGDGLADQVLKKGGDANVYSKLNKGEKVNLLKKVDRPLGGSFVISYQRQGNRVDYSDPEQRIDMPSNQWVLSSVDLDDGQGNVYTTSYDYFDDAFYDREERQAYGFARVKATLGDGSTVDTHYHNQDFYQRNLPYKAVRADAQGFLYLVENKTYQLRQVADQSFFPAEVGEEMVFYEGTTKDELGFSKSKSQSFDYDDLGNVVLSETILDEGPEQSLRVTIDYRFEPTLYWVKPDHLVAENLAGNVLRERWATYTDLGDLESLVQLLNGGRNPENGQPYVDTPIETTFTYFEDGNLETITDSSGYKLAYSYDDATRTYVTGILDSFGYTTAIDYNLKYGLPTATTDENGNVLSRVYDGFGRLSQVFAPGDPDGQPTIAMSYAPGASPAYAVTDHKDITRPGDPIQTAVFVNGLSQAIQTKRDTTYDDGGTFKDGLQVSGRIVFDERARIKQQGQPAFSTAPLTQFSDVPLTNPTAFSYDILDRVRQVAFPQNASTRIEYGFGELDGVKRLLRTRYDALDRATKSYENTAGSVIGVEQRNTVAGDQMALITRYGYNALQSLLSVSDPQGNTTSIQYDSLGRQIVLDNPDAGRTEYRYSLAGNLGAEISANLAAAGQQISYAYTYHRLDLIDYPVTTDVTYTYGEPGADCNRANRVVSVSDESGVDTRCYSEIGQLIESQKLANTIGGNSPLGPYATQWAYDRFDRLLEVVYPDGEKLSYGFDAGGRAVSASGVKDGETTVYVARRGYDQFGDPVQMDYGNGVVERRSYDPKSRFLANLSAAGGSAGQFQNLIFSRDAAGSISQIDNQVQPLQGPIVNGPVVQKFGYDELYQLVHAEGTYQSPPNKLSSYTLDLAYDSLNNITRKNQLHTIQSGGGPPIVQKKTTYDWAYLYENKQPNAPSHIGERTYRYDANGNQSGWESDNTGQRRTIVWDEKNRVKSVADQGRTTRFLYNADSQRTNKRGSLGETVYLNPYFSIRNGAIGSKQIFVDSQRIATRIVQPPIPAASGQEEGDGEGGQDGEEGEGDELPIIEKKLYFYHGDELSSTEYVTDKDAELFQHFEYFPFGEPWVEESSVTQRTPYLWTSKELDVQTGLYYFGFRYFEPRQSQWISADPILDKMLDIGAFEEPDLSVLPYRQPGQMYAYTSNDPINLVDPDGLFPPSRLLYRFMSQGELDNLLDYKREAQGKPALLDAYAEILIEGLGILVSASDFGEVMFNHTMTASGGGQIGSEASFISMTSDVEKLIQSTDDTVQGIVKNAAIIATFEVPQAAAVNAASDLSITEGEVLVPNALPALGAMLIDYRPNPYKE